MTFVKDLKQARDNGFLAELYKRGFLSRKTIAYLDIYMDKTTKHLTYQDQADRLGVSVSTVLRAINSIK